MFKVCSDIEDWNLLISSHEKNIIKKFMNKNDGIFIDVGAHAGLWTLKLANFYKKVICFEPNPNTFKVLCKNIELNNLKNVKVENIALSDKKGKIKLYLYKFPGHTSIYEIHPIDKEKSKGFIEVNAIPLDEYEIDEKISLIKIDTEGSEINIINGAIRKIKENKPKMVIELHNKNDEKIIREILNFYDFSEDFYINSKYLIHI
jgi:FkbM family methyltransferase